MSMGAALKASRVVELATQVLAIETLAAAQGLDLLAPLTSSAPLERVRQLIRAHIPALETDRPPSPDIEWIANQIERGALELSTGLTIS